MSEWHQIKGGGAYEAQRLEPHLISALVVDLQRKMGRKHYEPHLILALSLT